MGTVTIFRGKAATGKTALSDLLARRLKISVLRKDDIVDALKTTQGIDKSLITNAVCYNILRGIIQTNLDLEGDLILDIALGNRDHAQTFFDSLDFRNTRVVGFFTVCGDMAEWKRRHLERLENPLPHQSFRSFEHVLEHYENGDVSPFDWEHVIDTADSMENCFEAVLRQVTAL